MVATVIVGVRLSRAIVASVVVAIVAPVVVLGAYAWRFASVSNFSLSRDPDDWARFGEYIGGSLGALYALLAFGGDALRD